MRYYPYSDEIVEMGWVCPRCGRVNAPFRSFCDCKVSVSYTRETTSTAPTGKSYTIEPSSYCTVSHVTTDDYDPTVTSKKYPSTRTIDEDTDYEKSTHRCYSY